jgi:hypothetical protein
MALARIARIAKEEKISDDQNFPIVFLAILAILARDIPISYFRSANHLMHWRTTMQRSWREILLLP